jgi:hypothetical protein
MDIDPKGVNDGNASNNNDKEETNEKNTVEGMQVQSNLVDAIQIGTLKIPISPTDILASAKNSGKKELFFERILHDLSLILNDKFCSDLHVDSLASVPTSGLPQVSGVKAVAPLPLAETLLSTQQPGAGGQTVQQSAAAGQSRGDSEHWARQAEPLPANGVQGTSAMVGYNVPVGGHRRCGIAPETGSSVAVVKSPRLLCTSPAAQKIMSNDAIVHVVSFEERANQ